MVVHSVLKLLIEIIKIDMKKEKEIWVDNILFRPELYSISNTGKIKNKKTGLILKSRINKYGYEDLNLGSRKNNYRGYVHRMVFKAFNPEINILKQDIHHIDGNKLNNNLYNLKNINKKDHCSNHASTRVGTLSPNFKGPIAAFDENTGELKSVLYGRKDIEKHGFHHSHVCFVISGKAKSHKGHVFKRLKDSENLKIGQIYDYRKI
jgi:hypothetical protein